MSVTPPGFVCLCSKSRGQHSPLISDRTASGYSLSFPPEVVASAGASSDRSRLVRVEFGPKQASIVRQINPVPKAIIPTIAITALAMGYGLTAVPAQPKKAIDRPPQMANHESDRQTC